MRTAAPRQLALLTAASAALVAAFAWPAVLLPAQGATLESDIRGQIEQINKDVADKKRDMNALSSRISGYKNLILQKREEGADLKDQIDLLETRIARTQLSIDIVKKEVEGLELEVKALDLRIADKETEMERQRALMSGLSRKLYRAQFNRTAFEILFSHDTFSEFFDEIRAMSDMQNGMNRALASLKDIHAQLAEERGNRSLAQEQLAAKQQELLEEREKLEDDRSLKNAVLVETESSELRYRYLLAELQREQQEADEDIERLEKALREKIDVADRLGGGDTVLSWPVQPTRGISTRFHDPEYPFRYVYEHPGLDIRAGQGTPIRAPASGIVARAKDAGYGYSYIMVLHNNDISTVFGHVSKISVKEDTFVERGEILGYSGGTPGTPGAGRMTTGPHLHFEVRKNGIPVDPMGYLVNL
jgi:murein DD-endopeptidase MepM/ murein hydrolase activator NlpD